MTTNIRLLGLSLLTVLLASCGSQTPATPVNPVGIWSGTGQSNNGSGPTTLTVTETAQGIYGGTVKDEVSGTTFFDLSCIVSGTNMTCLVTYPDPVNGDLTVSMEGPISETSYTGDLVVSSNAANSEALTGTFDLSRPAQP